MKGPHYPIYWLCNISSTKSSMFPSFPLPNLLATAKAQNGTIIILNIIERILLHELLISLSVELLQKAH